MTNYSVVESCDAKLSERVDFSFEVVMIYRRSSPVSQPKRDGKTIWYKTAEEINSKNSSRTIIHHIMVIIHLKISQRVKSLLFYACEAFSSF